MLKARKDLNLLISIFIFFYMDDFLMEDLISSILSIAHCKGLAELSLRRSRRGRC